MHDIYVVNVLLADLFNRVVDALDDRAVLPVLDGLQQVNDLLRGSELLREQIVA